MLRRATKAKGARRLKTRWAFGVAGAAPTPTPKATSARRSCLGKRSESKSLAARCQCRADVRLQSATASPELVLGCGRAAELAKWPPPRVATGAIELELRRRPARMTPSVWSERFSSGLRNLRELLRAAGPAFCHLPLASGQPPRRATIRVLLVQAAGHGNGAASPGSHSASSGELDGHGRRAAARRVIT